MFPGTDEFEAQFSLSLSSLSLLLLLFPSSSTTKLNKAKQSKVNKQTKEKNGLGTCVS